MSQPNYWIDNPSRVVIDTTEQIQEKAKGYKNFGKATTLPPELAARAQDMAERLRRDLLVLEDREKGEKDTKNVRIRLTALLDEMENFSTSSATIRYIEDKRRAS